MIKEGVQHEQTTLSHVRGFKTRSLAAMKSREICGRMSLSDCACVSAAGIHVVLERFMKLNQELHRVQAVYQDIMRQGGEASDPGRRIKEQMEKGWSVCLSDCLSVCLCLSFSLPFLENSLSAPVCSMKPRLIVCVVTSTLTAYLTRTQP